MIPAYSGPALLVMDIGADHAVDVDLYVETDGHLKQWLGTATITSHDFEGFAPGMLGPGHLVMLADDRKGRVLVTEGSAGSDQVELVGSGPPPFNFA